MGHSNSQIFEQHYLSRRVRQDVQAAYLGRPSEDALIEAAGRMSRSIDPRLPKTLSDDQLSQIECHAKVQELSRSREILRAEIISLHEKIGHAVGTPMHDKYTQLSRALRNEKQYQKMALLKEVRDRHHQEAPVNDIQRQLNGSSFLISDRDSAAPDIATHTFAERSRIAKTFFSGPISLVDEDCSRRVEVIKDLTALCALREVRLRRIYHQRGLSFKWGDDNNDDDEMKDTPLSNDPESESSQVESFPLECKPLQCIFCLGEKGLGNRHKMSLFSRKDSLKRHVEAHLKGFTENDKIYCRHPICEEAKVVLEGISRFKNHAARVHKVFM